MHYASHFGRTKIHKNCFYWSVFNTDKYRKIIFNIVCKFYEFSQYIPQFFLRHAGKLRKRLYLRVFFIIVIYGNSNSSFLVF